MSTNVGEIDLSLILNSDKFKSQLKNIDGQANTASSKISSSLAKIGKAAIAAFPIFANDDEILEEAVFACPSMFFSCDLNLSLLSIKLKSISPTFVLIHLTSLISHGFKHILYVFHCCIIIFLTYLRCRFS